MRNPFARQFPGFRIEAGTDVMQGARQKCAPIANIV